jgi:hypothetical protein
MKNEDFDKAIETVQDGDFFSIDVADDAPMNQLPGFLIQWGTGAYAHIGYVKHILLDIACEAVDKGFIPTQLSSYKGKKGVGITFWRLKDLTPDKIKLMQDMCDKLVQEKHPYDWTVIARLSFRQLIYKIPILGHFIKPMLERVPFYGDNNKNLYCSEAGAIIARTVYSDFRKGFEPNQITPTDFCQSSKLVQVSRAVADGV